MIRPKNNFLSFKGKTSPRTKNFFFGLMTPKKKLAYILVNRLMANFEFRSCRVKKVNFFCHRAPTVGGPKNFFCSNFFKCTRRLKFQKILESEQQGGIWIYLVNLKTGGAAPPTRGTPSPKYCGWWTLPMSWSNHQSFVKIWDIEVCQVFVSCVDILLNDSP